jgi:tRNA_anti-like/zinc-ribbon domain
MFCQKCGAQIESGAQFCGKCGAALTNTGEAPETAIHEQPQTKNRRSLKLFGWLLVVLAVGAVFTPVPNEVALVLAFLLSWMGWSMVFPGTSVIKRAGGGFVGAILLTVLMDFVGGMVSTNNAKPDADALKVPIDALVQDYKTNEVGADQKYKGRVVETEGSVVEIKQDIANNPYVVVGGPLAGFSALFGKGVSEGLQCSLSATGARQSAKLKPGDSVVIQGRVVGLLIFVQAKDCLFVERPQPKPSATSTQSAPPASASEPTGTPQSATSTSPAVDSESGTVFTLQRTLTFRELTPSEKLQLANTSASNVVSEGASIAEADLNDDGAVELVIQSTSSTFCGSGGCVTIVFEKSSQGYRELLNQNLPRELGVTAEKSGAYRALCAVVDNKIVVGDQQGTPLFGKQMVYPVK